MASRPDEQNRLTVAPVVSTGKSAIRAATLPMLSPCSASGKEQPIIRSSTSFFSRFSVFSTAADKIKDKRSSGRVSLNAPLPLLQPGVRILVTIYASRILNPPIISRLKAAPTKYLHCFLFIQTTCPMPYVLCSHGKSSSSEKNLC